MIVWTRMLVDNGADPRCLKPCELWRDITTTDAHSEVGYDTADHSVNITLTLPGDRNQMIQKTHTVRPGAGKVSLESGFDAYNLEVGSYVEY